MMRELATGITRTYLSNQHWVNTVRVPCQTELGSYHTIAYAGTGLGPTVAERRSPDLAGALANHAALCDAVAGYPRREAKKGRSKTKAVA